MPYMSRVRTIACVLVETALIVTLLSGSAYAVSADDLRKIVSFKNIDLKTLPGYTTALGVVMTSGSSVVHNLSFINALAIALPADDITGALASLLSSVYVEEVAADLLTMVDPICPTTALTSTESYPWGQQQIDVPAVHQQWPGLQGSGVTVAVLDTGIDWTHLNNLVGEFYQRNAGGYNARPGGGSPADDHGHGTHIAGIIAAALNNLGIIGTAPKANLAAVKVLDRNGLGYSSDVINGLQWVYDNGIPLVNMSFGFSSPSTPLRQAIQLLGNTGIIMVASAGNRCVAATASEDGGGDDCGPAATCNAPLTAVTYPAAYPAVIAVAATDIHEDITEYSLSGAEVEVAAPGGARTSGQILSTNTAGGYGEGYGTSQAAAHVTGVIALALQLQPGLSVAQVRDVLKATAVDLGYPKEQQGAGRIDAKAMIEALP